MIKNKMAYALSAIAVVSCVGVFGTGGDAFADEGCFSYGETSYSKFSDARNAIEATETKTGTIVLTCSKSVTSKYSINAGTDITFDLNGFTYSVSDNNKDGFGVKPGATFTVTDSSSSKSGFFRAGRTGIINEGQLSVLNASIIAGENGSAIATKSDRPVLIKDSLVSGYTSFTSTYPALDIYGGDVTVDNSEIMLSRPNTSLIQVADGGNLVMESGSLKANGSKMVGVAVFGESTFTMNGGEISAKSFGLSGNGTEVEWGTTFNLNAGTIKSDTLAIYHPQVGTVNIGDGMKIQGGYGGIEMRAGTLNVEGGEFSVNDDAEYSVVANGNGPTTTGAAVAVAQHTTKQPINVTISGGTFTAPVVFSEANPQNNSEEDIAKVTASVTGGIFTGEILSEDLVDFVTGGQYAIPPAEEDIIPGHEAEETYEGSGIYEIVPINIDWKDDYLEKLYDGEYAVVVDFQSELFADHRASLKTSELSDLSDFKLTNGGDLLMALDIDMVDRDDVRIEVKNNKIHVYIDLSEEDYNKLSAYDKIQIVYLDENGNETERLDAELFNDNDWYWVEFETTHLSTYGVVGVNEGEEASDKENGAGISTTQVDRLPQEVTISSYG